MTTYTNNEDMINYLMDGKFKKFLNLIKSGKADVNYTNSKGWSPLRILPTKYAGEQNILAGLLVLEYGADVNLDLKDKKSPLSVAVCSDDNYDYIKLLLEEGAEVNNLDFRNSTPLHTAYLMNRKDDVIKLLLEYGADPSIKDVDGKAYNEVKRHREYDF